MSKIYGTENPWSRIVEKESILESMSNNIDGSVIAKAAAYTGYAIAKATCTMR